MTSRIQDFSVSHTNGDYIVRNEQTAFGFLYKVEPLVDKFKNYFITYQKPLQKAGLPKDAELAQIKGKIAEIRNRIQTEYSKMGCFRKLSYMCCCSSTRRKHQSDKLLLKTLREAVEERVQIISNVMYQWNLQIKDKKDDPEIDSD